ncbi:MAG TPA: organic hydroperoxide resistance protein [Acidimicrobiales bacterium]|nr:organic hydroperoxide resistance protein [Acidimicrobiales bacterium]
MAVEVKYEAEGTAWGGREGRVSSSSGRLDLQLSMPKELGGPGGEGTNPEELFAVGYAACFHSALKLVASRSHVDVSQSAVTVRVGIGADDADGGFGLAVRITGELPGVPADDARQLLEQAHAVCPYSKATRHNIEVELVVEG